MTTPVTPSATTPMIPGAAPPLEALRRMRVRAGTTGAVFTVVALVFGILDPAQLLRSYLVAVLFWLAVAAGSLGVLMMGHVAPGAWTVMLRRILEAASRTMLPLFILFLPIFLGVKYIYPWTRPAVLADPEVAAKRAYLSIPFFEVRSVLYFALWAFFAWLVSRMSAREDLAVDAELPRRLRLVSALGLVVYCLTMTFASIDWMMSLTPRWISTIYGVYVIGGQAVAAMAFGILMALVLSRGRPDTPFQTRHFHDFGKMLLAFVMLWAYFSLSQLLVQWSGNLPEEVPYYMARLQGSYRWASIALLLGHFAVPFVLLLSRDVKRDARRLGTIAGLLLVFRWLDLYWLVAPAFPEERARLHFLDPVAFLAVGGIWCAFFAAELMKRPLVPTGEPLLPEALEQHG
ncbi:MAG: hypothetical protein U0441_13200 [Polyangiaceae bacterium]